MTHASLLQDWDLLQRRVVPTLLEASEQVRVWTLGSRADAVVVAAAFARAISRDHRRDVRVYSSPSGGPERVLFCFSELAALPPAERREWFERRDGRWGPVRSVAERVIMAEPARSVDLVTWPGPTAPPTYVLARLRPGGLLLAAERTFRPVCGLEPAGEEPRLVRRTGKAPTRARGRSADEDGETLAAREEQAELVEAHLGLARALASRFAHRGQSQEELEAVGYLALVSAARRYNPERGAFAPYATVSLLGELKRHFRDRTWAVRVPRQTQERYLVISAARDELTQRLGASPTVQQVADHLGLAEEDVLQAMDAGQAHRTESLDATLPGSQRVVEVPVHDKALEDTVERERLRQVLPTLPQPDQVILKRLFFDGWTQQQTADELGVSQMQVSRLLARTLASLRQSILYGPAIPADGTDTT